MSDPTEDALAAAIRTMQELDQQLAAARDANGRLTARMVAGEIRERLLTDQLEQATDRTDRLEQQIALYHEATKQLSDALVDALGLTGAYQKRLTAPWTPGATHD